MPTDTKDSPGTKLPSAGSPGRLAMRAGGFAGGFEPLVQAGAMEVLVARAAALTWQLPIRCGHYGVADETLFQPRKLAGAVGPPECHCVCQGAVLAA
jgi:hypothetical protein